MGLSPREAVQRWRLVLSRDPLSGEAGQRDQLAAWDAALIASGLPVAGLDAPKVKPRFAPAAPLAAALAGEAELVDVWLVERVPRWRVRESLAEVMPAGHRLLDLYDVWQGEAALPGRVTASVYRAELADVAPGDLEVAVAQLVAAETLPRERRRGEATVTYDLRPFLVDLRMDAAEPHPCLWMTLRHDPERGIGRPEEVLAALGDELGTPPTVVDLVRESILLAEPAAPSPPAPRRGPGRGPARGRSAGSLQATGDTASGDRPVGNR